jgi:hypothetical protein
MFILKWLLPVYFIGCCLPGLVIAGDFYGGFGYGLSSSRISTWDDKELTEALTLCAGYSLTKDISLEAGYLHFSDIEVDSVRDSISEYSLTFARDDVYLAPVFQFKPKYFIPIRLKAGLTYSNVKMTVEEYFYGVAPQGSASKKDEIMGVFLSLGVIPVDHRHMSSVFSIEYIHRPDVFSESERSFDSKEVMILFSLYFK